MLTTSRRLLRRLAATALPAVAAGCFHTPPAPLSTPPQPGSRAYLLRYPGGEREYLLHVPAGWDGGRRVPLVIVMHGSHADGRDIEKQTGMSETADREGFVVAYPTSARRSGWDALGNRDMPALRALLDTLEARLPIDPARVYVSGFSSGGVMAHRVGAELGDRVAAIGVVSGTIGRVTANGTRELTPAPVRPLPVVIFHGLKDVIVAYDGGEDKAEHYRTLPVSESVRFWADADHCPPTPRTYRPAPDVEAERFVCPEGNSVVLYTILDGPHGWPRVRDPDGPGPAPAEGIDANATIWNFFEAHPLHAGVQGM